MICLWCNQDKPETSYSGKAKHCRECHNKKYKKIKEDRTSIEIKCPNCNTIRNMRSDSYKKRKNDYCQKCSPLFNKQLFISNHKMDTNHPIYKRWCCMKRRVICDSKAKYYKDKGIKVCDEWLDYENFYNWAINNGFDENLELDRIDASGNYCPENCQWITHRENTLKIEHLFGR